MRNDPGEWTVDVVVQNDSCLRSVNAQFEFAPAQFGFRAYAVMLVYDDVWQTIVPNTEKKRLLVNEVDYFNDHNHRTQQQSNRRHYTSPRCHHLANPTRHNAVFDSAPLAALCENVTLSTKRRQKMTEPRPRLTCTENVVKFGGFWDKRADRQTDIQTHWWQYFAPLPQAK